LNTKARILVSLTVIILILSFQNVCGAEFEYYCEQSDGSKFFYDRGNLIYSSGKIRVWNSVLLSKLGIEYLKRDIEMNNITPYKIQTYNEIDCKEMKFRILSVIFCGEAESVLRTMDDSPHRLIVPNTCPEELFNILCKKGK
jgi:hypothetical protein